MDIVSLKTASQNKKQRRPRSNVRRHTTEVRFEDLHDTSLLHTKRDSVISLSDENISSNAIVDTHHLGSNSHFANGQDQSLSSSWSSLFDLEDLESPNDSEYGFFEGSQVDVYQELRSTKPSNDLDVAKHQYQLSYELALDNMLTPFANHVPSVASPLTHAKQKPKLSHVGHVIQEIVSTEMGYVKDLTEVIDGYSFPLLSRVGVLPLKDCDLERLFGNITEIRDFHQSLLASLKDSGTNPEKVGECFLQNAEGFKIYTQYCNNYPSSVNVLAQLTQDPEVSRFMKICQHRLDHMLPLGAYLLKPVQRVLKYSLLLRDMLKHIRTDAVGYGTVKRALQTMTEVGEHINEMKKKYDAAVHVQEIHSLIRGNEGLDLTKYGELILEENFRYSGGRSTGSTFRGRTERYMFLFQKLCLITKKEEDGYQYKTHLEMKDLQLTEKVEKDPNSFHIRQVSTGRSYTFHARTIQQKQLWVRSIKLQLMDSLPDLPDKAKEMILKGFPTISGPVESSSPSRRHRHHSEEPVLPSMLSLKADVAKRKARTLGHGFIPGLGQTTKKPRGRSTTSPNIKSNVATTSLVQASLTGLLSASVHQQDSSHISQEEEIKSQFQSTGDVYSESGQIIIQTSGELRDSGYAETNGVQDENMRYQGIDEQVVQNTKNIHHFREEAKDVNPQPGILGKSVSSPQLSRKTYSNQNFGCDASPTRLSKAVFSDYQDTSSGKQSFGEMQNHTEMANEPPLSPVRITRIDSVESVNDNHQEYGNSDEVEIVCTNFSTQQPDVEIEIEQDGLSPSMKLRIAGVDEKIPDAEDLFDELMGSVPDTPLSTGNLSQALIPDVIPTSCLTMSGENVPMDFPADPLIPPDQANDDFYNHSPVTPPGEFTNYCNEDEDDAATPKGSPYVSPATIRRWSVRKRRSYDQADPDSQTTPKASPYIRRHKTVHNTSNSQKQYKEHCPSLNDPFSPLQDSKTQSVFDSRNGQSEISSSQKSKSSVVRRHSFGSHAKLIIQSHHKQGSLSTDNTPQSSPRPKNRKKSKKSKRNSSSPTESEGRKTSTGSKQNFKADISVIGFVGSTRTELSLDDLQPLNLEPLVSDQQSSSRTSLILPPPDEFCQPEIDDDPKHSSVEFTPDGVHPVTHSVTAGPLDTSTRVPSSQPSSRKSRFNIYKVRNNSKNTHSETKTPTEEHTQSPEIIITPSDSETESACVSVVPPYQSNPEELLSFDEILDSFDRYADVTGKTNRGQASRALSPQPKKKSRKKKRDRSLTVANIDAETMKQVKEEVAKNESRRLLQLQDGASSKVQKLAREYSQRIRENDKTHLLKRYSTVTEDSTYSDKLVTDYKEPVWLQKLRERNKSASHDGIDESDTSASTILDSDEHNDKHRDVTSDNELHYPRRKTEQATKRRSQTMKLTISEDNATFSSIKQQTDRAEAVGLDTKHDQQRKGKFRGWVRSLVDRFSTNKEKH